MEDRKCKSRSITPKNIDNPSNYEEGYNFKSPYSDKSNKKDKIFFNNFKSFYLGGDNSYRRSFGCQFFGSPLPRGNSEETNDKFLNGKYIYKSKLNLEGKENDYMQEGKKKNYIDCGYKTFNNIFPINLLENKRKNINPKYVGLNINKTSRNLLLNLNKELSSKKFNSSLRKNIKENRKTKFMNKFEKKSTSNVNFLNSQEFEKGKKIGENTNDVKNFTLKSFNIPRNQNKIIDLNKPMNKLAQSIGKSLTGVKGLSYENAFSPEKLSECKKENIKLINILDKQTNNIFLKFANLPKISNSFNHQKFKTIKNNEVEKIKYMGDRYNPYNFQVRNDSEYIRRNFVGGLFSH
jgi:hypothetical protein